MVWCFSICCSVVVQYFLLNGVLWFFSGNMNTNKSDTVFNLFWVWTCEYTHRCPKSIGVGINNSTRLARSFKSQLQGKTNIYQFCLFDCSDSWYKCYIRILYHPNEICIGKWPSRADLSKTTSLPQCQYPIFPKRP